ncbi:DUF4124 domain-containing protein [Kangiella sp. TOML190]|uniref:DUF4124 domain-containing protein n=1 Tax=Kangiella sp. TOML190 TaxID=2931351 RepID=UPI00203D1A72|nr:DUF4124 domain-containing protein [Kangiella sp. TOML190]
MSLKFKLFLIFALPLTWVHNHAQAQDKVMYKKVDKNGRIIFTDKPIAGSKKVTVDTSKNLMSIPKIKPKTKEQVAESNTEAPYEVLAIEQPANDDRVKMQNGSLYVIVAMTPNLSANHSIRLILNGEMVGDDQKVPYFTLTELKKGKHQLIAEVFDDETKALVQSSPSIDFQLR